jgi:hypothetical protein
VEYGGLQERKCGVGRGSSGGDLLCRCVDLMYLGKCEILLWLLFLENGVCGLYLYCVRRLESVGDGVEVSICLCVGSGKVPWCWMVYLVGDSVKGSRKKNEEGGDRRIAP